MRSIKFLLPPFVMLMLLAGCVSIPLTDGGSIEISTDGITINEGEKEVDTEQEQEKQGGDEIQSQPKEEQQEPTQETEGQQNSETPVSKDVGREKQESSDPPADEESEDYSESVDHEADVVEGFGGCENEFYLSMNRLPKDIPIPQCVPIERFEYLVDDEANTRDMILEFTEAGTMEEVYATYRTFFTASGYAITTEQLDASNGTLSVSGEGSDIVISYAKVNATEVQIIVHSKESPIKTYKVVNSIINQMGNGFGKCSDEYYTLLAHLTPEFPMGECVEVTFIHMTSHNWIVQGSGGYRVDGPWAEEYDKYLQYATANGYEITVDNAQATQGELVFQSTDVKVSVSIENRGLTNAVVQVEFMPL